jgi:hypothetical protein
MRYKVAGLAVVALALTFSAVPQAGQQAAKTAAAQKLPPLSYVCTMPQDADVLEDHPGKCPKCGMELVPVRLDAKWWCPVHQALEVHDGPGKCRRDGRDLVQVTVSEYWTCSNAPDKKELEPGSCSDGTPRKIGYELRAHGDHNPRHGGQFFMASDAWHHIEGTYPQNGLFRVFFYDNFTKPLALKGKGITGSLVIRDDKDKEIASVPLAIGRDGSTMEAKVPAANAALPLRATVKLKLTATTPEQPFDFQFNEYSKDTAPAGTPVGPTATPRPTTTGAAAAKTPSTTAASTAKAPAAPAASKPAATASAAKPASAAPPAAPKAPAATAPATASAPAATASAPSASTTPTTTAAVQEGSSAQSQPPDLYAGEIAPMPPALAAALNEDSLPKTVPELIAELTNRSGQIDSLMKEGSLSEVWLPAMGTKTVALVLESHASALPPEKRAQVSSAVKRVVTSAWEIDGYGDLGNKTKIVEAYQRLSTAVNDLKAAYEGVR